MGSLDPHGPNPVSEGEGAASEGEPTDVRTDLGSVEFIREVRRVRKMLGGGMRQAGLIAALGMARTGFPVALVGPEPRVLSLDGETPLQTLQHLFETLPPRDQELIQRNLFMGVAMDPLLEDVRQGDFLVRNVIGIDPKRGAVAVGALLREGQIVQFHVRDAETSAEDLRLSLSGYLASSAERATGALMFSCTGRGRYLYGKPDHDTAVFHELIGDLPLGGFFCNGEIGPVAGTTYLHGYTSSFGIFRPRVTAD